ncbi:hypothetical protein [Novosphingobium sp. Gsoil 351]|uniref:hypothetical protein n=1 Tax=Novosphingobium sp. Gsoil 351 TaxID=2675225 RepID=UPI0012B46328|nr:hypothetical protein [Novosphingobium sp. Gsoil 351]QGN55531.1 hypothetical protein GKE62_14180 [Novosphingobium sp. Gsoil 351]
MKIVLAAAIAALFAGGAAQAQTPAATGDSDVPSCSRTVTDHCIQRGEAMRAAPAAHHHAAMRHHHAGKGAMKRHHHRAVRHAKARRQAAHVAHHSAPAVKPKG